MALRTLISWHDNERFKSGHHAADEPEKAFVQTLDLAAVIANCPGSAVLGRHWCRDTAPARLIACRDGIRDRTRIFPKPGKSCCNSNQFAGRIARAIDADL